MPALCPLALDSLQVDRGQDYISTFGLNKFLRKRKLRKGTEHLSEIMSAVPSTLKASKCLRIDAFLGAILRMSSFFRLRMSS